MRRLFKLASAVLPVCFSALLSSCGGGDSETAPSAASSGRERALSLPPGTTIPADASTKGLFGPVQPFPLITVHAVLTPDGRVLSYGTDTTGKQTGNFNYAVWNSVNNIHETLANGTGTDIFCSSQLVLPAGDKVFIAGGDNWTGTATTNTGNNNSNLFTVADRALVRQNNMNRARWYSSSITLLNGETYIQGGTGGTDRPEVRATDGSFRLLSTTDTNTLDFMYARNFIAPDGRVFGFDSAGRMYYVNPAGTGSITMAGQFSSATTGSDATAAMFAPGRILQVGGGSNNAIVIDINGGTPSVTNTAAMLRQRKLASATILPNGRVVVTGGSSVWNELTNVSYEAEIWNPQTGQWTVGASHVNARLYHSIGLLLPDATVLVSGGGAPGPLNNRNGEIYYPPYLFTSNAQLAPRPAINTAPTVTDPGRTMSLTVTSARPISRITFVKTGSVTHGWNMDQRFVELPFTASGNTVSAQVPARASDVPPGMWMAFAIDDLGVPSEAKLVRVNVAPTLNTAVTPVLTAPGNQLSTLGNAVNLSVSASDPNGDTLSYSASGLPTGLSISSSTGVISGTPTATGSFSVVLVVSDGYNTASTSFTWQVNGTTGLTLTPVIAPAPSVSGANASFSASASGSNVLYRWDFGDGSAPTGWSGNGSASKIYSAPGIYYVTVTVTDDSLTQQSATLLHQVYLPGTTTAPSVSSNMLFEPRSGANARLWVVNPDNDSVSVFDAVTRARSAEVTVGAAPRTLAIAPDGSVWVVNKGGASISVISASTLTVTRTIALARGSQPFGIAMMNGASSALVALEATGQLLKISTTGFNTTGALAVGANPRHVAVAGDGSTAFVSRFITPPLSGEPRATVATTGGGEVLQVNAAAMTVTRTLTLAHSNKADAENQGRGFPNYLGAAAISPDGTQAFVPSKQDNILRGGTRDGLALNFQNTVRAISSRLTLGGTPAEDLAARIDHDNASVASAAAFDPLGVYLFVALETSREVAVIDAHRRNQILRIDVGRAPQGLVVSPDRLTLYVHNFMDRTVSVFDLAPLTQQALASVPLLATLNAVATEKLLATVLKGKQFFYDARDTRLARDRYMSCATCHNDGGHDGRVWDLKSQGEGLRNTIALRGRAGAQGLLHWSANFDEVQDFEGQIRTLAGGTGLMSDTSFNAGTRSQPLGDPKAGVSADLDALAAYVGSLNSFEPSPYRDAAGALTAAGSAGRAVFLAQNCAACHGGTAFTNSAGMGLQNIGTLKPSSGTRLGATLTGIDIPTLRDVGQTGPYLHDGSAPTLDAAVLAHNGVSLTSADLSSLVQYLREIGSEEATAPGTPPTPAGLVAAYGFNEGTGTASADLTGNGHTAALQNGTAWAVGQYGNALSFDGLDDQVALGNPATIGTGAADFTFMAWVKRSALGGQQRHIFSRCDPSAWQAGCKEFYFNPSNVLTLGDYPSGDTFSVTIADTNWHHIALVFTRATNTVQFYVDGTLRTTATKNLEADNAAHGLTIGNLFGNNTFSGLIDEVRIYSRALTAAQIGTDMNTPLAPVADTTPPVLSGGLPSGVLAAGTTQTTMSVTSNENATCRYATAAGTAYGSMTNTFSTTGGTTHSTLVTGLANGQSYSRYVRCQDTVGNADTVDLAISFSVAVPDTTAPAVSVSAPAAGATVTGTVSVNANAGDNVGVVGVQFLLDGVNLGAEDTVAPYTVSWNTASATNGAHTLTARARDAASNQTTSAVVGVTVSNAVPDTTPPTVTANTPATGAIGVGGTANVTAAFSEALDATTINTTTFELRDAANALVAAAVTYDAATRVATLNPTPTLTQAAVYTATVKGGATDPRVKDVAGNALAANVTWSFTIAPDTTAPTVTATSPASGATGVSRTANITATFSEAMDATTINSTTVELRGPSNVLVAAAVSYGATNRRVTLNPTSTLASLTTYTMTIKGGTTDPRVKDSAGNALATNVSWSFTTR